MFINTSKFALLCLRTKCHRLNDCPLSGEKDLLSLPSIILKVFSLKKEERKDGQYREILRGVNVRNTNFISKNLFIVSQKKHFITNNLLLITPEKSTVATVNYHYSIFYTIFYT